MPARTQRHCLPALPPVRSLPDGTNAVKWIALCYDPTSLDTPQLIDCACVWQRQCNRRPAGSLAPPGRCSSLGALSALPRRPLQVGPQFSSHQGGRPPVRRTAGAQGYRRCAAARVLAVLPQAAPWRGGHHRHAVQPNPTHHPHRHQQQRRHERRRDCRRRGGRSGGSRCAMHSCAWLASLRQSLLTAHACWVQLALLHPPLTPLPTCLPACHCRRRRRWDHGVEEPLLQEAPGLLRPRG